MEELEKIKILLDKGYVYNETTGEVISPNSKIINNVNKYGYINIWFKINIRTFRVFAHRFAFYFKYKHLPIMIDHINRDRTDNKISNLRAANSKLNNQNRTCNGFSFCKRSNKYRSKIKVDGKTINIGTHDTKEEAIESYLSAKKIYHNI